MNDPAAIAPPPSIRGTRLRVVAFLVALSVLVGLSSSACANSRALKVSRSSSFSPTPMK
jgi:hypothetical protein